MPRLMHNINQVAGTDATVLITGETGTGKELIARAIHANSLRRSHPLIKINCAALPTELIESELFGHQKGAFTGALANKPGRFELANGGTLFLDEIGDIPIESQAKLLRALQEQEFERVGGNSTIKIDVRVIAATNRVLVNRIAAGEFREDLFYRLNVFPIHSAPLREVEQEMIQSALKDCAWKIEGESGAATRLAMAPSTLRERIKKYGLKRYGSDAVTATDPVQVD